MYTVYVHIVAKLNRVTCGGSSLSPAPHFCTCLSALVEIYWKNYILMNTHWLGWVVTIYQFQYNITFTPIHQPKIISIQFSSIFFLSVYKSRPWSVLRYFLWIIHMFKHKHNIIHKKCRWMYIVLWCKNSSWYLINLELKTLAYLYQITFLYHYILYSRWKFSLKLFYSTPSLPIMYLCTVYVHSRIIVMTLSLYRGTI